MEVEWNDYATKDKMIRICIGKEKMIIRQEDLETYLLALTKDPSRFMRSETKKVGIKYVPVSNSEYQKYKEWKKRGQIK